MKNENINFGLLLLTVVALVLIPQVSVYGSYLSRTGIDSCRICHTNPMDGGHRIL